VAKVHADLGLVITKPGFGLELVSSDFVNIAVKNVNKQQAELGLKKR